VLPFAQELRLRQRELDGFYRGCIRQTKDADGRERLRQEHERASMLAEEELLGRRTPRLIRQAAAYNIFTPEKPWALAEQGGDETWGCGGGTAEPTRWYLRPAALAALQRQIEEARQDRAPVSARQRIVRALGLLAMGVVGAVGVVAWFILLVLR
jgi:hypothetical protein